MTRDFESKVGKRSLVQDQGPDAASTPGKRTLTEQLDDTARAGLASAGQPYPHLDLLAQYLNPEQHATLARTPVAIGGPANAAARAMGTAMNSKVGGWTLDSKVAFPGAPSVADAMHEGAHVLGADEALAEHAAERVSRGERVDALFPRDGAPRAATSGPQFVQLSSSETSDLLGKWTGKGLAESTVKSVLSLNLAKLDRWPQHSDLESFLETLWTRAKALEGWLAQSKPTAGHKCLIEEIVDADGKNNQGIFRVHDLTTDAKYVVKALNPGVTYDLKKLTDLNKQDVVTNPVPDQAKVAQLVDWGASEIRGGGFKNEPPTFGVLQAAPGKSLAAIHDEYIAQPDKLGTLCQIYETLGKAFGALNFGHTKKPFVSSVSVNRLPVISHNDTNPTNIFYDEQTRVVTLIDNDSVGHQQGLQPPMRDVGDVFIPAKNSARTAGEQRNARPDEQGVLSGEQRLNAEIDLFDTFATGYLPTSAHIDGLRALLAAKFNEQRAEIFKAYLDKCTVARPSIDVLRVRFPRHDHVIE
jgi:hypothetical protein